jgi:hypothetical protein
VGKDIVGEILRRVGKGQEKWWNKDRLLHRKRKDNVRSSGPLIAQYLHWACGKPGYPQDHPKSMLMH